MMFSSKCGAAASALALIAGLALVPAPASAATTVDCESTSPAHPGYYNSQVGETVYDTSISVGVCYVEPGNTLYYKVDNHHGSGLSGWSGTLRHSSPTGGVIQNFPQPAYGGTGRTSQQPFSAGQTYDLSIHYTYGGRNYTFNGYAYRTNAAT